MKTASILLLLAFLSVATSAQSRQGQIGRSAQGTLTVNIVIDSSVGFVTTQDGRQQLIVANAPDPRETFSRQTPAPVVYNFPGWSSHFDVMHTTQRINVAGSKANYQPVTITTVVPQ